MTTGIGNEWDPGDPPEIHKERKLRNRKTKLPIISKQDLAFLTAPYTDEDIDRMSRKTNVSTD